MIISLVSEFNGIGKSEIAKLARDRLGFKMVSFAGPLRSAASEFIEDSIGKDHEHPYLHVTRRQIVNAIAAALDELHPELPVHLIKRKIEALVEVGYSVIIDDTRRQSEFLWLDDLAYKHGTVHEVLEIVPEPGIAPFPLSLSPDEWTNGKEPCGKEAWPVDRCRLFNDGTENFWDASKIAIRLIDGGIKSRQLRAEEL